MSPLKKTVLVAVGSSLLILIASLWTTSHVKADSTTPKILSACVTTPSVSTCDGSDPIQAGCVQGSIPQVVEIPDPFGEQVGELVRWYSPACHSYWAQLFSYRNIRPEGSVLAVSIGVHDVVYSPQNANEAHTHLYYQDPAIHGALSPSAAGCVAAPNGGFFDPSGPNAAFIF
jgi:hypothetical protein